MEQDEKGRVRKVKNVNAEKRGTLRAAVKPGKVDASTSTPAQTATPQSPKPAATASAPANTPASSQALSTSLEKLIESYMSQLPGGGLSETLWGRYIPTKEEAARTYFQIPASEKVRLILDASIFGTCKAGFALCDQGGLYFRDDRGQCGHMDWKDFKNAQLACNSTLFAIGDHRFLCRNGQYLGQLLLQIQACIN